MQPTLKNWLALGVASGTALYLATTGYVGINEAGPDQILNYQAALQNMKDLFLPSYGSCVSGTLVGCIAHKWLYSTLPENNGLEEIVGE